MLVMRLVGSLVVLMRCWSRCRRRGVRVLRLERIVLWLWLLLLLLDLGFMVQDSGF